MALDDVDAFNGAVRVLPYPALPAGASEGLFLEDCLPRNLYDKEEGTTLGVGAGDAVGVGGVHGGARTVGQKASCHLERAAAYPHTPAELDRMSLQRWRKKKQKKQDDGVDGDADEDADATLSSAFDDVRVVSVRAGTVLAMSDRVLHCSGPNATGRTRRAWMPQFSAGAMTTTTTTAEEEEEEAGEGVMHRKGTPVALAVPLRSIKGYSSSASCT